MFFGYAKLLCSHFNETADFSNAHFDGYANFRSAHFGGHANFENAHFDDASFQSAQFEYANFQSAHFNDANFQSAHFDAYAFFSSAHFEGYAKFESANFDYASFQSTHFEGYAVFLGAHFGGYAVFESARFNGYADFSDGVFKARTVFKLAQFALVAPKFFQCKMHQDTSFSDDADLWPTPDQINAENGKRAYTRLRQIAAEIGNPDDEHFFLRQEFKCKEVLAKGFDRAWFFAFRWIADSGIEVARPFWFLVVVWAFGTGCFAGHFDSGVSGLVYEDVLDSRYRAAIGVSFGNVYGFLGINRLYYTELLQEVPDNLQLVAGAQTVLGVVFLFFFGLGLRNRFRLR